MQQFNTGHWPSRQTVTTGLTMHQKQMLDKAKLLNGSDAATARKIGMPKQHISNVRYGLRSLTPYQSAKLAELVGEPWHVAALERLTELSQTEAERQFWQRKSETLRGIAARVATAVFLTNGAVLPSRAGNETVSRLSIDQTTYRALVRIGRTAALWASQSGFPGSDRTVRARRSRAPLHVPSLRRADRFAAGWTPTTAGS